MVPWMGFLNSYPTGFLWVFKSTNPSSPWVLHISSLLQLISPHAVIYTCRPEFQAWWSRGMVKGIATWTQVFCSGCKSFPLQGPMIRRLGKFTQLQNSFFKILGLHKAWNSSREVKEEVLQDSCFTLLFLRKKISTIFFCPAFFSHGYIC